MEKHSGVSRTIIGRLLDASTSIGANLEEAIAAQSKADFIHKNAIALKEARESTYWIRLIIATEHFKPSILSGMLDLEEESHAISKIIGKRIVSTKAK